MLAISVTKPDHVKVADIPIPEPSPYEARINFSSGPLAASSVQLKLRWSSG